MGTIMNGIFDLSEKVIAITGGYGHLGGAMTEGLLQHGATVLVLARSESKFEDRFKHLKKLPYFFETDIKNLTSVKSSVELIAQKFGRLDGFMNPLRQM